MQGRPDPLELELKAVLSYPVEVLVTKFRSSVRAVCALNQRHFFSPPKTFYKWHF